VCDAVRTPFGRTGGALAALRSDDLGAVPIQALVERNPRVDWSAVDDVIYGCANQAGEDQRNVARAVALLGGLPASVPGLTVNRSCASGLEAVAVAARAVKLHEGALFVAGGVESTSRAPVVVPKTEAAVLPGAKLAETALGWRFINPLIHARFGSYSSAEAAEKVAAEFRISRDDQDAFAYRSQQRALSAFLTGATGEEVVPVLVPQKSSVKMLVQRDEHPRTETTLRALSKLKPIARDGWTVTAGNSAAEGDGACALLVASYAAAKRFDLLPRARIVAVAAVGVEPGAHVVGPVLAAQRVLARAGLHLSQVELVELNEVSAAEALAVLRELGLPDDAEFANPNGGTIALGHPLAASGARLVASAVEQLRRTAVRYALCVTGCGLEQGMAMLLERV